MSDPSTEKDPSTWLLEFFKAPKCDKSIGGPWGESVKCLLPPDHDSDHASYNGAILTWPR